MDPNNPIVKLCAEGMQAEAAGRPEDARVLFERAWTERADAFEASIAAHYVARHQPTPEETLRWNQEALARADEVGDERVRSFYPSLLLNLGYSHHVLGDRAEALRCYQLAADQTDLLGDDPYGALVRSAIAKRIAEASQV